MVLLYVVAALAVIVPAVAGPVLAYGPVRRLAQPGGGQDGHGR